MRIVAVALISLCAAVAQTPPGSVTVTAFRNVAVPADEAVFNVSVLTPLSEDLKSVLTAASGVNLTASNLASVYTVGQGANQNLAWSFNLALPFADVPSTASALLNLEKSLAARNKPWVVSFSIEGNQVSEQAQAAISCSYADLIADARSQAQLLADAAGRGLGPILAVADASAGATASGIIGIPGLNIAAWFDVAPGPAVTARQSCAIAVTFGLLFAH